MCETVHRNFAFHATRSLASARTNQSSLRSALTTCSQVFLGRPLPLLPATFKVLQFFTQLSTLILSTWPNHLRRFFRRTFFMGLRPNLWRSSAEGILSISLAPAIQRSIDISVCCNFIRSTSFTGQVSLPVEKSCLAFYLFA